MVIGVALGMATEVTAAVVGVTVVDGGVATDDNHQLSHKLPCQRTSRWRREVIVVHGWF
jgi:hypothetical protein